jgi:hypothetical protein
MSETVFVRDAKFDAVEKEVRNILAEVDKGKYDAELAQAGIQRSSASLNDKLQISGSGEGLSPNEWFEIIVIFGPTVATIAKDVWSLVVVPQLKRIFRSDRVSPDNPNKKNKKKKK